MHGLHPIVSDWFTGRFGQPTDPQRLGWPEIMAGRHTLIAAPTGSGKTLAAFLASIDRLLRQACAGELTGGVQVVYVSPLKALSNDIHRNLEIPLGEIRELAAQAGYDLPPIRSFVRTGDTPSSQRQAMLRSPPHILVTTPESLFLLLTSPKSRDLLRTVRTVIVDEIHALARDKRGSHLSLSLERLERLCEQPLVRVGLSATQAPLDQIARFLIGNKGDSSGDPNCSIIDVGHMRSLDLAIEVPPSELSAVCSKEQWDEIYARLAEMIRTHRSTIVFVNTRRLAERVSHHLSETLGSEAVASHHGSLSRDIRLSAEERLKSGELKAIVATASLEMGIDVGYIDLVCQIGSPRAIATLLQRVGRSGHSLGALPKGRLLPLTRDELLESMALIHAVRLGHLDKIEIPRAPLDILAQQIVAATACEEWSENELFQVCKQAWPYRDLKRDDYNDIVAMLTEGVAPGRRNGALLYRDVIGGRLKARRGARLAAITSGGAIPENADFRVLTEGDRTFVGTVNEDFALESLAGDIFLLGNTSWRIRYVRGGEVVVNDAQGAPATIPFWLGEAPGRTIELSAEVSALREQVAGLIAAGNANGSGTLRSSNGLAQKAVEWRDEPLRIAELGEASNGHESGIDDSTALNGAASLNGPALVLDSAIKWLQENCGAGDWAADQTARYVAAQQAAVGLVPTQREILFERFFDESGGMQLVIHAPLGARINRAWGLALRKRFCRSFDFELQASADDNGIVLSLGPQHSFPIEALFKMLNTENAEPLLTQALLAAPMFQTRWRWNATRALAVLRQRGGKRVPPQIQRFRADDLLAAVFPQQTGCLENHHGDIQIPDHPLVRQTVTDCLHEAMDLPRWIDVLGRIQGQEIRLFALETREPSPFSHEILNANPYAFLDGAPLEERRARAVATRRGLTIEAMQDLGRLDPEAIRQVCAEAWPLVRDADELHDVLLTMGVLPAAEGVPWQTWFDELLAAGRATVIRQSGAADLWTAAERWPLASAVYADAWADPPVVLPDTVRQDWDSAAALVNIVRGRLQCSGPVTTERLAEDLGLDESRIAAALEALEGEGTAIRGRFTSPAA